MSVQYTATGFQGWRARRACAALLLFGLIPVLSAPAAWAQASGTTQAAPANSLHAPAKQKSVKAPVAAPTPPLAAPRPAVQQQGAKPPPLVKPKGSAHAQPPTKGGPKAAAKTPAQQGTTAPGGGPVPAKQSPGGNIIKNIWDSLT